MFYKWNVIGHERELARLETEILSKTLHHAYLFVGPQSIGKFHIAKIFAQILQCPNNFCGTCPTCIQVEKGSHADTITMANDGESVKMADVRDLLTRLSMTGQSQYKIVLLDDIGRLTDANALLKILEEPPPRTIFVFTARNGKDILPTISSRMRMVHFKKIPPTTLKHALKEAFPEKDDAALEQCVLLSMGRSGRALQLLGDPVQFDEVQELYRKIEFLHRKASKATRMITVGDISKDTAQMNLFLSLLVHYMRNELYVETDFGSRARYIEVIEKAHAVLNLLERNVNPRLLLEDLMLTM